MLICVQVGRPIHRCCDTTSRKKSVFHGEQGQTSLELASNPHYDSPGIVHAYTSSEPRVLQCDLQF